ncbi:MAG: PAS domain S-box protein [Desulfobacterales bacterium]|nr:PAS domain S-box protein [Desulfobacterales bacterium]
MKEYSEDERIIERALFADKIVRLVLLPLLFGIIVVAYIKGIPYPLIPIVILLVTFYISAQISLALIKRNFYPRRVFFLRLMIDIVLIAIAVHYGGGIESPFFILLGIVFIMSAIVLPFKHSLFVLLSGGVAYITEIWLEYYRIIPHIQIFKIFGANAFQDTAYILTFSMIIVAVFVGMAILTGYLIRVLDAQVKEISRAKAHSDSLVKDMEEIKAALEDTVKERTRELEETIAELTRTKTATLNILEDVNKTKEELIQAKEYMESMINSLVDPMVTTDTRGIITSFREGVQEFLGYESQDMIGRHVSLVYRDGKEEAKRIMKVLEKDGKLENYETIFVSRDGRGIPSLLSASFLRDAEGKITGTLGIAKDISKIKRLEDELRETKDFLERILESSADSIVTTDMDGKITFVNAGAEVIFGYEKGEAIGTHISQYYAHGLEEAKKVGKIVKEEGRLHFGEIDFLKKDGTGITLSMSYDLLRDDKGIIIGMVAVGKDVTEKKRIERELIQTKDSLESVIEGITDPIVTTDTKGIVTSINNALTELVGYEREDAVGKRISFIYADGIEYAKKMMGLLSEQGIVRNHETQFIKKDGSLFPAIVSMSLLRDKSGEVIGTLGICKDITERKRLEEELKHAKDFLENTLESITDPFVTTDRGGIVTSINKGFTEVFGYNTEIIGKHISIVYYGGMGEAKKLMGLLNEGGIMRNYETQFIKKDGTLFYAIASISLMRNDRGDVIGTLGICKDITKRKTLEDELKGTKSFLESILESSPNSIVVTDEKGRITYVNRYSEDLVGFSREERIGTPAMKYYAGGPEVAGKLGRLLREKGEVQNYEVEFIKKGGGTVLANVSASLMKDQDGKVIGTLGISQDISEKKRLETELKETKDFLENMIEGSIDAIVTTSIKGVITFANRGTTDLMGYKLEETVGTHVSEYYVGGIEEARKIDRILREREGRLKNYETEFIAKGDRLVPVSVSVSLLKNNKGEAMGTLGVFRDITQNKRLERELGRLSITDNLTGLYNQRHFYNELKRETERAKRLNHPLSLLLFDIDGFKSYNDTYGHLQGDKALNKVGRVVSESIRVNVDSGYRYGGDEFVVILPETNKDQAFSAAERIRTSFNTAGLVDVTLSVGLIEYRKEYDLETFVKHADKAMYTAKHLGGDKIIVHE